ncbi:division/cell wall cluster transcriptional repressor MraZ [Sphingomonas qilianensis]|uniref:Division/cell wall cluster transcriptional repressor MraZ n=1 Tax=Sphingomonas qilianensis TaxID=1736690 RepID=A0ABU9XWM1_9SPHN
MDEIFLGSALSEVTSGGDLLLPRYFHETVQRRSAAGRLFIGLHETSPCLVVYDRHYATQRHYDTADPLNDDPQRLRRSYGFVEQTIVAPDGMIVLPPLMRDRGGIGSTALLVAIGERFEIWDFEAVLRDGPTELVQLATHHRLTHIANEVLQVSALSPYRSRRDLGLGAGLGTHVQSMPALQPRHDPIGDTCGH